MKEEVKPIAVRVDVPETTEYMMVMVAYKDAAGHDQTESVIIENIKELIAQIKAKRRAVS